MIHGIKPYPAYKDSGVTWLAEVPVHWDIRPSRAIFAEVKERDCPGEEMLSVTIARGVVRQHDLLSDSSKKDSSNQDKSAYKLVRPGDLVYNKMRAWQGAIGASEYQGIVSPAYVVVRPCDGHVPRYFHYLFRTPAFTHEAERWSYGITSDQWSLRPENFKMVYCSLPPPEEQSSIVRFLDHADRRIRRYIAAKRKLIALLNAQKQAIIHSAVTRGLDPGVRLKPSGVEWLGEVPAHWSIQRVKSLARKGSDAFTDGDWIEAPYITREGIRLIQTGNIGIGEYREKGFRYISEETFCALNCTEVKPNDILICRLDGPVGRACLAPDLGSRLITSVDNAILKPRAEVDVRYVVHVMSSTGWLSWIDSVCRAGGGFRYRISRSMLGNFLIPLPPSAEQRAIADFINQECEATAIVLRRITAEIHLLHEYRTRLTDDVVTGKLDVREAAARLPEEGRELEPLEEAEDQVEDADGEGTSFAADEAD